VGFAAAGRDVTRLAELVLSADPQAWRDAGFAVDDRGVSQVGLVRLRLDPSGADAGLRSWALVAAPNTGTTDVDGLPTGHTTPPSTSAPPSAHPIGASVIDHLVVTTPDLARTIAAFETGLGLPLLRTRDTESAGAPMRQAFFRMGEVVLEVVEGAEPDPRGGPARFYGLAITVEDFDAAVERAGDGIGRPKPAVQPGRSIATFRKEAALGVPVAIMSPAPARGAGAR
jgi:catechol 2,3-dioxygenase-like lactoylglutathione lyase family enzyme